MKKIAILTGLILFLGATLVLSQASAQRFVNKNGMILDTDTCLMWAPQDNGSNINFDAAQSYCTGYAGGGYAGWKMPSETELKNLYSAGGFGSISAHGPIWSSDTCSSTFFPQAKVVYPNSGMSVCQRQSLQQYRALPVRIDRSCMQQPTSN